MSKRKITRREFIGKSIKGAGLLGLGVAMSYGNTFVSGGETGC